MLFKRLMNAQAARKFLRRLVPLDENLFTLVFADHRKVGNPLLGVFGDRDQEGMKLVQNPLNR
ncbi:hypothetical protein BFO01nite_48810 [Brevibacillus formosus]|uniref:Uncharacterized protein n=1 Tax=Brevibacillus formosus TaxID=54913 RepID=A0ABQ0TER5_9BACL|nr:hypothetical protein BFO01nite_48810 [Brevibacillus formosus]